MRKRFAVPLAALAVAAGHLTACQAPADNGKVQVVTTVAPITNIVQNIGGELVDVTGIVPEGANSHTFEPAPSDAAVLA